MSALPKAPSRVIAYLRVSTLDQADKGISLEAQEEKARAYANLYELDLVAVMEDRGESAKTLDRPELKRALSMLEAGKADGLLVAKLDRLTRSVRDLGYLLEDYFAEGRFSLMSVVESVDTRTAAGRLVLNVLVSVAQWERETTSERTRDALAHLRRQGVRMGAAALGWEYREGRNAGGHKRHGAVEEELVTVQRIRVLRQQKHSLRQIAEILTREGRKTKRGGRWGAETVRKVLVRTRRSGHAKGRVASACGAGAS